MSRRKMDSVKCKDSKTGKWQRFRVGTKTPTANGYCPSDYSVGFEKAGSDGRMYTIREFSRRIGRGRNKGQSIKYNRWVLVKSLKKLDSELKNYLIDLLKTSYNVHKDDVIRLNDIRKVLKYNMQQMAKLNNVDSKLDGLKGLVGELKKQEANIVEEFNSMNWAGVEGMESLDDTFENSLFDKRVNEDYYENLQDTFGEEGTNALKAMNENTYKIIKQIYDQLKNMENVDEKALKQLEDILSKLIRTDESGFSSLEPFKVGDAVFGINTETGFDNTQIVENLEDTFGKVGVQELINTFIKPLAHFEQGMKTLSSELSQIKNSTELDNALRIFFQKNPHMSMANDMSKIQEQLNKMRLENANQMSKLTDESAKEIYKLQDKLNKTKLELKKYTDTKLLEDQASKYCSHNGILYKKGSYQKLDANLAKKITLARDKHKCDSKDMESVYNKTYCKYQNTAYNNFTGIITRKLDNNSVNECKIGALYKSLLTMITKSSGVIAASRKPKKVKLFIKDMIGSQSYDSNGEVNNNEFLYEDVKVSDIKKLTDELKDKFGFRDSGVVSYVGGIITQRWPLSKDKNMHENSKLFFEAYYKTRIMLIADQYIKDIINTRPNDVATYIRLLGEVPVYQDSFGVLQSLLLVELKAGTIGKNLIVSQQANEIQNLQNNLNVTANKLKNTQDQLKKTKKLQEQVGEVKQNLQKQQQFTGANKLQIKTNPTTKPSSVTAAPQTNNVPQATSTQNTTSMYLNPNEPVSTQLSQSQYGPLLNNSMAQLTSAQPNYNFASAPSDSTNLDTSKKPTIQTPNATPAQSKWGTIGFPVRSGIRNCNDCKPITVVNNGVCAKACFDTWKKISNKNFHKVTSSDKKKVLGTYGVSKKPDGGLKWISINSTYMSPKKEQYGNEKAKFLNHFFKDAKGKNKSQSLSPTNLPSDFTSRSNWYNAMEKHFK